MGEEASRIVNSLEAGPLSFDGFAIVLSISDVQEYSRGIADEHERLRILNMNIVPGVALERGPFKRASPRSFSVAELAHSTQLIADITLETSQTKP